MRLLIKYILISATLFLLNGISVNGQTATKNVENLSLRIKSIEKVEELYSLRYAVNQYTAKEDLTLHQQRLLLNSMKLLSGEFKIRNHFRNAADVYKDYLEYNNKYLIRYNAFAIDSLKAAYKIVETNELATINSLDTEISGLTETRAAVSGLKTKYYSFGGFGTLAVIVLTLVISLSKNRAIAQAKTHINSNQNKLISLNNITTESGMAEGTVIFCKKSATNNLQLLEEIIESLDQKANNSVSPKEIDALKIASLKLSKLAS